MNHRPADCRMVDLAGPCVCPLGGRFEASHLFDEGELRWVTLAELVRSMGIACIDGRHRECALGSPGGDAGELLLILSAVEQVRGVELGLELVRSALRDYASSQGRFSFHTDREALEALLSRIDSPGGSRHTERVDVDPVERFVHASDGERDALCSMVAQPEHVGCGHLRSMLVAPAAYRVRPKLVGMAIEASIAELWERSASVQFSVLKGSHLERAVVTFQSCQTFDSESAIPTPCGTGERGVFVHHGAVLDYLRGRVLGHLVQGSLLELKLAEVTNDLKHEIRRRACEHLAETLDRLAPELDRYCVHFDSQRRHLEQSYRVSQ